MSTTGARQHEHGNTSTACNDPCLYGIMMLLKPTFPRLMLYSRLASSALPSFQNAGILVLRVLRVGSGFARSLGRFVKIIISQINQEVNLARESNPREGLNTNPSCNRHANESRWGTRTPSQRSGVQ